MHRELLSAQRDCGFLKEEICDFVFIKHVNGNYQKLFEDFPSIVIRIDLDISWQ